jgi:hypothetical protein
MFEVGKEYEYKLSNSPYSGLKIRVTALFADESSSTYIWLSGVVTEGKDRISTGTVWGKNLAVPSEWILCSGLKSVQEKYSSCTRTSRDLFIYGCKCDGFKAEMEARKK